MVMSPLKGKPIVRHCFKRLATSIQRSTTTLPVTVPVPVACCATRAVPLELLFSVILPSAASVPAVSVSVPVSDCMPEAMVAVPLALFNTRLPTVPVPDSDWSAVPVSVRWSIVPLLFRFSSRKSSSADVTFTVSPDAICN